MWRCVGYRVLWYLPEHRCCTERICTEESMRIFKFRLNTYDKTEFCSVLGKEAEFFFFLMKNRNMLKEMSPVLIYHGS